MQLVPLDRDWNAIRDSYLQGKPALEIVKDYQVSLYALRIKAQQQGWRELQKVAQEFARNELSEEIRSNVLISVVKEAKLIRDYEIRSLESDEHERVSKNRERLVATAARLLGWDAEAEIAAARTSWSSQAATVIDVPMSVAPLPDKA